MAALRVNPPPPQHIELERTKNHALPACSLSSTTPESMFGQQQSSRQHPRRHRRRVTSGQVTYSRSSNDILQRTTTVPLSPVMGPGTCFSSVASAFDFQHHLGSDPASELLVLKHILTRECLLSRLEALCDQLRKRFHLPTAMATSESARSRMREAIEVVIALLPRLRDVTVTVVKAISEWRKNMTGPLPSPFVWHGDNYLLKITNDLNFMAGVQPLVETLKLHPARFCRNPLMLPQTLDEQRRDGELCESGDDTTYPGAWKRRRLYQIAQILLDEEGFESERESLRQAPAKHTTSAFAGRGETSPELSGQHGRSACGAGYTVRSCATTSSVRKGGAQTFDGKPVSYMSSNSACGRDPVENDVMLRRQQRLSTWYEQARSQLVSLSASPADQEYFLSSRRFWSKEELGVTGGGASPPRPQRRPPGILARSGKRLGFAAAAPAAGREGVDPDRRDKAGRLSNDGVNSGVDLLGDRPPNRQQTGWVPLHQTRRLQGFRVYGHPRHPTTGSMCHRKGSHGERGEADVWSRPDRFGGGGSAALACLTVDDVEQILREVDPLPVTPAVCEAVVFLLAPDDQHPRDFVWPEGFEAVALPAEDFLWRLHETSGSAATASKAQFLAPVLQREYLLPQVIEQQGGHAVASLCAWVLEELQVFEEFAEWSEMALEPWYETQLVPAGEGMPESNEVTGCEVRLVYKALHMLPCVGGSFVLSLFEGKSGEGGLIVRAFDRTNQDTFWLPLSQNKVDAFGGNATRSPAILAAALTRRLKMKLDVTAGTKRLVLPTVKKVESACNKKTRAHAAKEDANSVGDNTGRAGAEAEADSGGKTGDNIGAKPFSSLPLTAEPATASVEGSPHRTSQPRRSHPPSVRGSKVDDLGPLVELDGDRNECFSKEGSDTRSESSIASVKGAAASVDEHALNRLKAEAVPVPVSAEDSARSPPPTYAIQSIALHSEECGERQEGPSVQTAKTIEPTLAPSDNSTGPNTVNGKGEPGTAEMEGSGYYAGNFSPENNEGTGSGLPGKAGETGMEECGSYVDDFAADTDENYDDDLEVEHQAGLEHQDQLVRVGGECASDVLRGGNMTSTTRSSVRLNSSDTDECLDETTVIDSTVPKIGGAGRKSSKTPSEENHTTRESGAAEHYDEEFQEEGTEQGQGTKTDTAPSSEVDAVLGTKKLRSSSADATSARDSGSLASQTLPSEQYEAEFDDVNGASSPGEGAESEQHTQEGDDDLRGTASTPKVPSDIIVDESVGFGVAGTRLVPEGAVPKAQSQNGVVSEVEEKDSQAGLMPEAATHPVHCSPLDQITPLILIHQLGNVATVSSVGGSYASEFEDESEEVQDDFESSAASEFAAEVVETAIGLALDKHMSGLSGTADAMVGEDSASDLKVAATRKKQEEKNDSRDMVGSTITVGDPACTRQIRSPQGREPPTGSQPSQDDFEGRLADAAADSDVGDSVTAGSNGGSHDVPAAGTTVFAPEPCNHISRSDCFGNNSSVQYGDEEVRVQRNSNLKTNPKELAPETPPSRKGEDPGVVVVGVAPPDAVIKDAEEDGFEEDFETEEAGHTPSPGGNTAASEPGALVPVKTPIPAELEPVPQLRPGHAEEDEDDGAEETENERPPKNSPAPEIRLQDDGDGFSGGPGGGQAQADEATVETISTAGGEDFEEDFEEDFASEESNEDNRSSSCGFVDASQGLAANSGVAEVGTTGRPAGTVQQGGGWDNSEGSNLQEPIAAARAGAGPGVHEGAQHLEHLIREEPVEVAPPLEEVGGNQAGGSLEEIARRSSVEKARGGNNTERNGSYNSINHNSSGHGSRSTAVEDP